VKNETAIDNMGYEDQILAIGMRIGDFADELLDFAFGVFYIMVHRKFR